VVERIYSKGQIYRKDWRISKNMRELVKEFESKMKNEKLRRV